MFKTVNLFKFSIANSRGDITLYTTCLSKKLLNFNLSFVDNPCGKLVVNTIANLPSMVVNEYDENVFPVMLVTWALNPLPRLPSLLISNLSLT